MKFMGNGISIIFEKKLNCTNNQPLILQKKTLKTRNSKNSHVPQHLRKDLDHRFIHDVLISTSQTSQHRR